YRLPQDDARAFCAPPFMPHRQAGSQHPFDFLSLVNALFTTLGEMWARRLPVFILYRIFHGFSERGREPGKLVFRRGIAAGRLRSDRDLGELAASQPF
ncbi:hypothetical protein, partial [Mesorhizobium sp. M7A.F.Ca.CA.001.05.1.1]|uniref:hypothetical protein n=1 Tax=Mesorhizobium sp. M7A.F.Ca.CA.001.05.1.1 TaxID=2496721 RepID=UPI0019D0A7A7